MIAYLTPTTFWFGEPPQLDIDPASDTRTRTRRMTRSATLDGDAVVNDGGYSEADRALSLQLRGLTLDQADMLAEIAAYPLCRLSLDHGLYEGRVKDHQLSSPTRARLTFWVSRRIA
ncbi:hypothetical protein [Endozoicomonas sp. 4G]|uniref:hypothetical protein n=1 Tax=Endozoicomonas sp. 4G TaxID=2872754 RepID=UPI002078F1E9|nr:hypothetical protein [Endozoicomonas sp. 4G]